MRCSPGFALPPSRFGAAGSSCAGLLKDKAEFQGSLNRRGARFMTGPEVLDVARDAIWTIVLVSSPLMVVGLVVGVVISLVQALTQIQEMTLVFVPKILAIFITMVLALPFMADALHAHMLRIASRIIGG
jgi:flagellar biosynthetic protein FliQ